MKPKDKWFLAIVGVLSISAIIGPKWHRQVQRDRGFYTYGFIRGEAARTPLGLQHPINSDPILRDERAREFFEEGYNDALSQTPPRYPYSPLRLDPKIFEPESNP